MTAAWRVDEAAGGVEGAHAFVMLMEAALRNKSGIELIWRDAGSGDWGDWAALGLKVSAKELEQLDTTLIEIAQELARKNFDELVDRIAEQIVTTDSEASARFEVEANRLAQNAAVRSKDNRTKKGFREVARKLLASPASLWAVRTSSR